MAVAKATRMHDMDIAFDNIDQSVRAYESTAMTDNDVNAKPSSTNSRTSPFFSTTSSPRKNGKVPFSISEAARFGRRRARLSTFLDAAKADLAALDQDTVKVAVDRAQGVCEYFGEDASTYKNVGAAFDTINAFLQAFGASLNAVLKTIDVDQKLEDRRKKSAKILERRLVETVDKAPKIHHKNNNATPKIQHKHHQLIHDEEPLAQTKSDGLVGSKVMKVKRRAPDVLPKAPDIWKPAALPEDDPQEEPADVPSAWASFAAIAMNTNSFASPRQQRR